MKKLIILMLLILSFLALFSCDKKSDKTVVRYMYWDIRYNEVFNLMEKEFEALNPNIDIVGEQVPWDQYWPKIEAATVGKDLPDVFWMNFPQFPRYYSADLFYDWEGNYGELTNLISHYPDSIKDVYFKDGDYIAFPKGIDTVAIFLNKRMFEDANVPIPSEDWTYEEFIDTINAFEGKLSDDEYAIAVTDTEQGGFEYFIYNNGGYLVSKDGKGHGLDLDATLKGIEEYKNIVTHKLAPDYNSLTETPIQNLFLNDKLAMVTLISVFIEVFADNPDLLANTITLPYPKINGQNKMVLQSVSDVISYDTKAPEAAKKWIEFMNSPRGLDIQAKDGIFFPLTEPYATIFTDQYPVDMAPFKDLNNTYSYPSVQNFNKYTVLYNRAIRRIVDEGVDAKTELSNVASEADKLF